MPFLLPAIPESRRIGDTMGNCSRDRSSRAGVGEGTGWTRRCPRPFLSMHAARSPVPARGMPLCDRLGDVIFRPSGRWRFGGEFQVHHRQLLTRNALGTGVLYETGARVFAAGYPDHITQRGNRRRQTVFCLTPTRSSATFQLKMT